MPRPGIIQAELKPEEVIELKYYLAKDGQLKPDGRGDGLGPSTATNVIRPFIERMRELHDDEFRKAYIKARG